MVGSIFPSSWAGALAVATGYSTAELIHRLRRRRATDRITMGVHVVVVPKPIALVERQPDLKDCDERGRCWFWDPATDPGIDDGVPSWELSEREPWHTHWLPANVEVLPARCCAPEVG